MISFDEAVQLIVQGAQPIAHEHVPIGAAKGRVLAESVVAMISAPPWDVSAMDGYAVADRDLASTPARLQVIGQSFAGGGADRPLEPGTCMRIFTGAPVPQGADRVVIQEMVKRDGDFALVEGPIGAARHIRAQGSDFKTGDILLEAGRILDARALVAAAAADIPEVVAWQRPKLVVLSTGDELVDPGQARTRPGSIPESVSFGIGALVEDWGAQLVGRRRLPDDLAQMQSSAGEALNRSDLVVVTGGASVGEKDFAKQMFESSGLDLLFSKVAIKPGKPVWFGRAGGRLVMGLPGNPTSAMVTARLLLAPLLAGLSGSDPHAALRWRRFPLAQPLEPNGDRETFARGSMAGGAVRVASNQDSSAQKTLAESDVLVRLRPHGGALAAGEVVEVLDF